MHLDLLKLIIGFDWDAGNATKNYDIHKVSQKEAEEIFVGEGFLLMPDFSHSEFENRYYGFGVTAAKRLLTVAFTLRNHSIRVIMARDMSRKERRWYEQEVKKDAIAED